MKDNIFYILSLVIITAFPSCREEKVMDSKYIDEIVRRAAGDADKMISPIIGYRDSIFNPSTRTLLQNELMEIDGIEDVSIYNNTVAVKFINGIERFWMEEIAYDFADLDSLDVLYNYGKKEDHSKCLIINSLSEDDILSWHLYPTSLYPSEFSYKLKNLFQTNGWDATVVNNVTLDFYKKGLTGYDVVFWMAHGSLGPSLKCEDGKIWISTNQIVDKDNLTTEVASLQKKGEVTLAYNKASDKCYLAISKDYLLSNYNKKDSPFKDCIFYLMSCNGLTNTNFSEVLIQNGASGVIGWKGVNKKSAKTGYSLFKNMFKGHSLGSAIETLNNNDKTDNCWAWTSENEKCGSPCLDYAELTSVINIGSADFVYLNQSNFSLFTLSNPSLDWNYPLNECFMPENNAYGSSNTLEFYYNENEFDENSNFKVDVLSVTENGHRDINTGYQNDSWININKGENKISIDMCSYFASSGYIDRTIIVTYGSHKSNTLFFRVNRPAGANKTEWGEPFDMSTN